MRRRVAPMVLLLLVVACGSMGTRESTEPSPPGAPFDAVPAVGGGQVDGAELAGRDLALWFWAPW